MKSGLNGVRNKSSKTEGNKQINTVKDYYMHHFTKYKDDFDNKYSNKKEFVCFLPVDTTLNKKTQIKGARGNPNEEYYKWQFLSGIVNSGMYAKDFIGTEVYFPKGNKSSAPIKFDGAIFDDKDWFNHYKNWGTDNEQKELDWLRQHLIGVIEFKREDSKDIETVYNQQLKPALKESEREFCLGVLYDTERLYLFRKHKNIFLRLNDEYNQKKEKSSTKDLSLHLPDPYRNIPTYEDLIDWVHPKEIDRSKRTIQDLDVVSGAHSQQINNAMSAILRTMEEKGMVNQRGYEILIQILALKIFDEKRNERNTKRHLVFYINKEEKTYKNLNDSVIQSFLLRINKLREDAEGVYYRILQDDPLNDKNENHVRVLVQVVNQFQDYSFVFSHKTDLYQLVFHRFAAEFSKQQNAQFVTPLPIIDFLVNIVNPRNGETVVDPTVGIADFLSVSYVNSNSKLNDGNIYGMEIDPQMIMLATLNMLLNGDGNATLKAEPGYGSILHKFDHKGDLLELIPQFNKNGNWDNRKDIKKLKKFDVVLTNPPFGEDRAWRPDPKTGETELAECYELWDIARAGDWIDKGLVFLENAYRILEDNGRLGIVLSNSIASIDRWQKAREWVMDKMRIVAIFDLPANVFAETGVNTTLLIAYKPTNKELQKLRTAGYKIFLKDIQKIGYEIRTSKRVKKFEPLYKINYTTFEVDIDKEGNPILNEEFTETVHEFREWCKTQEETLQDLYIRAK
ncbi:MAG: N-6 DNA methylase [Sedimentisphaerales bacterium]|nr:N-6 DNA methylase [Sedimentisphaerales bacterium]